MELRPSASVPSVVLEQRLAHLVLERQALRDGAASRFVLEQNRLEIVQMQLELSEALVSEHLEVASAS